MKEDVIICIGSVGYPTFNKCYKHVKNLQKADSRVKDVVVIRDRYPISEWLNEMRQQESSWVLQVDEDMYPNLDCLDHLFMLIKKNKNIKVLNASGLLLDLFLNIKIGSLKLWNTEAFKIVSFKDVRGSDRQYAKDAAKYGFQNIEIKKVLGKHDSAPNPEIAFFKYKEYIEKIRRFENYHAAENFTKHLKSIKDKRRDKIGDWAYAGGRIGLSSVDDGKTKNYKNNKITQSLLEQINKIKNEK